MIFFIRFLKSPLNSELRAFEIQYDRSTERDVGKSIKMKNIISKEYNNIIRHDNAYIDKMDCKR